ncbi:small ribosomal subunit protein bS21m-like [Saccoglossus kowalevskii]
MRHLRFIARTVMVQNGNVDAAYRSLNNMLGRENIIEIVKRRRYFEKPFRKRQRIEYETVKKIYNDEMHRKIQFLMRKNRTPPWVV